MLDDVELRELRIFLAVLVAAMRETGAQRARCRSTGGLPAALVGLTAGGRGLTAGGRGLAGPAGPGPARPGR